MAVITAPQKDLPFKRVFTTWWPLAFSWALMGLELPGLSAVIARLPNPEINLAAYGGVVFPIALIIESPIIMLLAASTALSKDWDSYCKLRRFMMAAGGVLTGLHILVAFTPLYYLVVEGIIGAPDVIVEPARIGLMIMTPWTWSIAYRRFNQGVLIRFGHSKTVSVGTLIRLIANWIILATGFMVGDIPGIIVATSAVTFGVVSEAIYVGIAIRPVREGELKAAPPVKEPLTRNAFLDFYIPLAMTSLLMLLAQPIGSAGLSRMPRALSSLAVWPVISGLIFFLRSLGIAYNEVVVALLDEPHSYKNLNRFAGILSLATTTVLLMIAATPLSIFWFEKVSALSPELADMARLGIWFAVPLPALSVMQSLYQGAIVHGRHTRAITEAVAIYLVVISLLLIAGVAWGRTTGLYIALGALTISVLVQTIWLWYRSLPVVREIKQQESLV